MSNTNFKKILTEYEKKRIQAIYDADLRKEQLYKKIPRLQEIDDTLSKEAIHASRLMISSRNPKIIENLNDKIADLKKEKNNLLTSYGKDESYLKPIYECKDCNDTGYITTNVLSEMCHCLKQKVFDIEYNKSNIYNLEKQNFNCFTSSLYSDKVDENKYNSKISPRENIEKIKSLCIHFINNFDDENEKNLLFTGNSGLGKSFLSSCIANELLKKGKTVLYQTAPVMLDTVIDYRFEKNNSSRDIYENLLTVDLLIIDDLGTECMNSMKFSELFNIINTRLLNSNHKATKTIISTNLSLQNLFSKYDERIISRIVGYYNSCYFFGDDIRFIKK